MASQEAWRVLKDYVSKLGLTHKELGEQVLAMGKLLHTVRHDLEGEESMENEAAIEAKIATQQEKVESDTTNITVSFKEQKQYCLRFELFAKRTDNNLKESIRKDKLYCKERAAKAKLCRVDNEKNFALVKKRRARARLRVKEILTASMKASKFAMNNEADSANRKVDELVVKRVEQSLLAHEAAIAALKYLEYTETIYLRRQGRKDLVSKNPDKVCFSEDIVLNSTLELTELQGEMKAKNEQAVRAAAGVKCTRDNLKLVERESKVPPCTAFRGDTAVKLWYDASKTKEATAKMNAVIVNAAILSAAANRTLFEELGSSKKDAMAIADAEEISRCKSHAVAVANALVKDQNAHNVRDEAFDRGDLCHADVRTVFIEFMAANRHRAGNPSRGKRLSYASSARQ